MNAPESTDNEGAESPAPRARLPLSHALYWVLGGGLLAQLAGSLAAQLVRTLLAGAGARGASLDGPAVVLPAMITSACALIGIAVLAPALAGVPLRSTLGLRHARPVTYAAAALGTVLLGPTADQAMSAMQAHFPQLSLGVVPKLTELVAGMSVLLAWPVFALLPGLSEELLFRGLLQRAAPAGTRAILLSAFTFALFHIDPHHAVGVLPLGLFLAWAASRCGTQVTIVAHVANNTAAIAALHLPGFAVGYGTDEPLPWFYLPPTLAGVALCALVIVKTSSGR